MVTPLSRRSVPSLLRAVSPVRAIPPERDLLYGGAAMLSDLRLAFRFLTRLPVDPADWQTGDLGRAAWAFPLVGVLVGLIGGVVYAAGRGLGLTPILAAIGAVGALVWVTGGLHEDGLADM